MVTSTQEPLETAVTLSQAARTLFPNRPNPATVSRWALYGARGVKLQTQLIGSRRYVRPSDVERFLAALNAPQSSPPVDNQASQRAADKLARIGF